MDFAPILKIFRLVAPDFAGIDDETVKGWIVLTDPLVSRRKFRHLHDQALALYVAHRMELSGILEPDDDMLEGIGNLAAGKWRHIASFSEGKTSISFNHEQGDLSTETDAEYELTKYGVQFVTLRDSVISTIVSAGQRLPGR